MLQHALIFWNHLLDFFVSGFIPLASFDLVACHSGWMCLLASASALEGETHRHTEPVCWLLVLCWPGPHHTRKYVHSQVLSDALLLPPRMCVPEGVRQVGQGRASTPGAHIGPALGQEADRHS